MNSAVERAAKCIWERYSEPLSLADIAQSALLSRFHFARVFRETTGVPPCRFLYAVRIYQAKHMLLTTSMGIADIAFAVGYNSLGSFTTRFTGSVGVSPRLFRHISQEGDSGLPCPQQDPSPGQGAIHGKISLPAGYAGARIYLGAFTTPIVQYRPASATVVDVPTDGQPSAYRLPDIPRGRWFIHAVGVADSTDPEPWTRRISLVGRHKAVSVAERRVTRGAISLRPRQLTDPPVLLALPDLEAQTAGSTRSEGGLIGTPRPDVVSSVHSRTVRRLWGAT
jgi:AraC family transcriptional regulator